VSCSSFLHSCLSPFWFPAVNQCSSQPSPMAPLHPDIRTGRTILFPLPGASTGSFRKDSGHLFWSAASCTVGQAFMISSCLMDLNRWVRSPGSLRRSPQKNCSCGPALTQKAPSIQIRKSRKSSTHACLAIGSKRSMSVSSPTT